MNACQQTIEWTWPDSILNPPNNVGEYQPDMPPDQRRLAALADQLSAWGSCMAGNKPPQCFGEAMATLSQISGATTPDKCMALSDELIGDK